MADLVFFAGTMDCGKSTLALQMDHNRRARSHRGVLFSKLDRAGDHLISSRLGLQRGAVEVDDAFDFWAYLVELAVGGSVVQYLICDEAQFYTPEQVDQLARIVDEMNIDVYAFGITSDFRTELFPGSKRLIELADRTQVLQVEALCWCGRRATHNARLLDGQMVTEGAQVIVGDTDDATTRESPGAAAVPVPQSGAVEYEVLCRRHHRQRMTSARAGLVAEPVLPFGAGG